jgi:actin-related protein 6
VDPKESRLLLTEAPFTPGVLAAYSTQVVFEEFGFAACAKLPAASLAAHRYRAEQHPQKQGHPQERQGQAEERLGPGPECVLVVDSGFSFTHVVPSYRGQAVRAGVRRVNVGGKLLTNFLKETVSYRQWNMMDEFQLMNDAKEALCYVSQDFAAEMARLKPGGGPNRKAREAEAEAGWEPIKRNFVLPDFQTTMRGYVQGPGQALASEDQQVRACLRACVSGVGGSRASKRVVN